jgi:hypothetical protein
MILARRGATALAAATAGGEQQSRFRFLVIMDLQRLAGLRSNPHDSTPWPTSEVSPGSARAAPAHGWLVAS